MNYLLVCIALAALALWFWLLSQAIDLWDETPGKLCAGAAFLMLAGALTAAIESEADHPCIEYSVERRYDPATKMTRPMKICVERGEWVL
jgi:hypothetical protein